MLMHAWGRVRRYVRRDKCEFEKQQRLQYQEHRTRVLLKSNILDEVRSNNCSAFSNDRTYSENGLDYRFRSDV